MEISLCMIVRNEQVHLAQCLDSVADAVDEIVILDTGSTDGTKEIARRYTPKVFDFIWREDFAAARNAAFAHATKSYLMWMDADDVLEEKEKLLALKQKLDGSVDAVMMPYICGRRRDGQPSLVFYRERIVRAGAGFAFEGRVHEAMRVFGNIIREEIAIRHTGDHAKTSNERNQRIYETWIAQGGELSPRDWHYYARELMTAQRYEEAERIFHRVTRETVWKEIRIDAQAKRAQCLLQLERSNEARAELLSALAIDAPRAQLLCLLGQCEMQAGREHAALFWYRAARLSETPSDAGAFVEADFYDYVPSMQLCVLLDRMGRTREAAQENERALIARPGDEAALKNRAYFEQKLGALEGE